MDVCTWTRRLPNSSTEDAESGLSRSRERSNSPDHQSSHGSDGGSSTSSQSSLGSSSRYGQSRSIREHPNSSYHRSSHQSATPSTLGHSTSRHEFQKCVLKKLVELTEEIVQLSTIGGKNIKDCTTKILDRLMTNSRMSSFNMKGHGSKRAFQPTELYTIVTAAVKRWDSKATDHEISRTMADHFKHAPGRSGGGGYLCDYEFVIIFNHEFRVASWRRLFNDLKMTAFTFQPNLNVFSTPGHDVFSTSFQPIFAGWDALLGSYRQNEKNLYVVWCICGSLLGSYRQCSRMHSIRSETCFLAIIVKFSHCKPEEGAIGSNVMHVV
ncbi:uncharacterized protein LOC129194623 [Dunckerocampus dactyliophorus]|uniref:uncharacterized protein LOC129194623 n=1 Tax=Dunckerocampus dactyliophorus TaxID=161453 RepID=UPI0024060BC6|nr:uncharacterized protein LOC129194623 [Dunckerocampus dactyliophorus]XP_054655810.1 uncharacterized protein LOC129194623 [Dunckerocampus dactyliophorus]